MSLLSISFIMASFIGTLGLLYYINTQHLPKIIKLILAPLPSLLIAVSMAYYVSNTFTGKGIDDSVLYQLQVGTEGAGLAAYKNLIMASIIALIISLGAIWVNYRYLINSPSVHQSALSENFTQKVRNHPFLLLLLLPLVLINPGTRDILYLFYINMQDESVQYKASFDAFYKQPHKNKEDTSAVSTATNPLDSDKSPKTKNLVFLYMESMERTYLDPKIFPGLMTNLKEIETQNLSFTNIMELSGTHWTIAGMVASQCGIPLTVSSKGNSLNGTDEFLSNTQCIGDILKANQYNLSYLGGEPLSFAGKGAFYKTHGFGAENVYGTDELLKLTKETLPKSSWGVYDNDLYNFIKKEYQMLSAKPQPFALFASTLDTHHPKGMNHPKCANLQYGDGKNSLLNAHLCADKLIKEFVDYIANSPAAKDTILVLASDHLAMNNSVYGTLVKEPNRRDLLVIIDFEKNMQAKALATTELSAETTPTVAQKVNKPASTLDTSPTVLHYLGIQDQNEIITQLGLGRSLLSQLPTLVETQGNNAKAASEQLRHWREMLLDLWHYPNLSKGFTLSKDTIKIQNRKFVGPFLMYFKDDLNINDIQFILKDDYAYQRKIPIEADTHFIWLDHCRYISMLLNRKELNQGLCMVVGTKQPDVVKLTSYVLGEKTKLTVRDINNIKLSADVFAHDEVPHATFNDWVNVFSQVKFEK